MSQIRRRTFIKAAGAAAFAATAPIGSLVRAASPNETLNHACIGVGGMMGYNDFKNFAQHKRVRIAALCDVDANFLARVAKEQPEARQYADWREMFAKEGDRIDSVNITIPDHMHAAATIAALKARKHVYCQKPMCHDVAEVRAVTQAAKAAGVRTQLGTQAASTVGSRMAVGMIQSGLIGKVQRVVLRANRPNIERWRPAGPRPNESHNPPETLKWDLWIGNAPMRPFVPSIYHPSTWRGWLDFGTGWSGDIGCHLGHSAWRALELGAPKTITAKAQESWVKDPARRADTWPQSNYVSWIFPGTRYTAGDVQVEWYDGEFVPDDNVNKLIDTGSYHYESTLFIGTDGALLLPNGGGPQLFPSAKFKDVNRPKLDGRHHYHDFVDACFSGQTTESDFAFSGPMSEAVLLGTVALRTPGTTLNWNAAAMTTASPDADALIRRKYRKGWEVEGIA